jgi:hypothetical protein
MYFRGYLKLLKATIHTIRNVGVVAHIDAGDRLMHDFYFSNYLDTDNNGFVISRENNNF